MKQVFSSKQGIVIKDIPEPSVAKGHIKIKVAYSCISAGTEMMTVNAERKSPIQKVLENPIHAINVVAGNGIKKTLNNVEVSNEKLGAIGYSVAGKVVEVGTDITDIKPGDLVSAGGAGMASHAEYVTVPKNLVVKIPEGLSLSIASMGTVGSIALHGVRRTELSLNEYGVVVGVGLMGLLAIQMLKASGVKVACTDINNDRLLLAKELGADKVINSAEEDPVQAVLNWTDGFGADAVLFTAATHSDEPLSQSFKMTRKKGKVVLLGVSGMNINREDIYKKEIDFCISTSYGPGRYDDNYENKGWDYPYAYVRWTENRNIYSFLELIRDGKINIDKMHPSIYPFEKASDAFQGIKTDPGHHVVTILEYNSKNVENNSKTTVELIKHNQLKKDRICIGLIGAGSFATNMLLPIIADNHDLFYLKTIANRTAVKAMNAAKQFKAEKVTTDNDEIFSDPDIDLVMICTRHGNHADLVLKGLQAGKNVYVEKPLATTMEQLARIENYFIANQNQAPCLFVGYNRRFSPYNIVIKEHLKHRTSPVFIHYRMNAGFAPIDSWVHADGGRIIGECCHLIDLMQFLIDSPIVNCSVSHFAPKTGIYLSEDNRSISLEFSDGSVSIIDYFSSGSKDLPKEFMEVHWESKSIIMDDYKSIKGYGIKIKKLDSEKPLKGHKEEWLALYEALKKGMCSIDVNCLLTTSKLSILSAQDGE